MASSAESPAANGRVFYVASTRNRMSCSIKCMCCQLLRERNGLFFPPLLKKWSIKMKDFSILTWECPLLTSQETLYFIKCRVVSISGNWLFFVPHSSSSPEAAILQHVQGRSGQTDSNSGRWMDWQRSTRQLHLAVSLTVHSRPPSLYHSVPKRTGPPWVLWGTKLREEVVISVFAFIWGAPFENDALI